MYQFRVSKKNKKTENLEPSAETGCKPLTSELCRNCAALVMVQNIIQTHLTSQHPRDLPFTVHELLPHGSFFIQHPIISEHQRPAGQQGASVSPTLSLFVHHSSLFSLIFIIHCGPGSALVPPQDPIKE